MRCVVSKEQKSQWWLPGLRDRQQVAGQVWRAGPTEPRAFTALPCTRPAPVLGVTLHPCTFEIFIFYCKFSAPGSLNREG